MLSNVITSMIRTYVPVAVGFVMAYLIDLGVTFPERGAVEEGVIAACIAIYYAAARLIESKYPNLGWLLGTAKRPEYIEPHEPEEVK